MPANVRNSLNGRRCRVMKVQMPELAKVCHDINDRKEPTARHECLAQEAMIRIRVIIAMAQIGHGDAATETRRICRAMQMGLDSS